MRIKLENIEQMKILYDLSCYEGYQSGNPLFDKIFDSIIENIYYKIQVLVNQYYTKKRKKTYTLILAKFEALAFYELYYVVSKTMDMTVPENVILMQKMTLLDKELRA